jgi:hypothetical protein
MNASDFYAPAVGGALAGVAGYAIRQRGTDMLVGAGGGVVLGLLFNASRDLKATQGKPLAGNPNAPSKPPTNVPPPPVGRPEIPVQAEQMFGAQSPDPSCFGIYRSYYGVHDWNEDENGVPRPVWDMLGRWHGDFFAQQMIPYLDQFYGSGYACAYNKGVWAVSPGAAHGSACAVGGSFVQVGQSRADCGLPPVAVAKG